MPHTPQDQPDDPLPQKGRGGARAAAFMLAILLVAGGVAGYLVMNGDETEGAASEGAPSETTEEAGESPPPDDDPLSVASLGATTPYPGASWELYDNPLEYYSEIEYALGVREDDRSPWTAYMEVGVLDRSEIPYDPDDPRGAAETAMNGWLSVYGVGLSRLEDPDEVERTFTDVEVGGRPAVLLEAKLTWLSGDEKFDVCTLLLVDVDGAEALAGLVCALDSDAALRQSALDALLATSFEDGVA